MAQTNDDVFAGLQFSFVPPGARSLAIGGAFVGRADDATAAYSNPAGLLWLERPEASLEAKAATYTTEYVDQGRLSGQPTNMGIDTFSTPQFTDFESDTSGVSFLSYAHPSESGKWALAIYRHELANFEVSIRSQGLFSDNIDNPKTGSVLADLDLLIENFGVSVAVEASQNLWLGLGVSYYRIDVDATTRRFDFEELFEPARFTPTHEFLRRTFVGDDSDVALIGGVLWRSHDRRWSVGAVYRQGPEFDANATLTFGPLAFERNRPRLEEKPETVARLSGPAQFQTPDVLGLGFSVRATSNLTVSFEYDRVTYSNLDPEKNVLLRGGDDRVLEAFDIDDADEFHLGLEYVILSMRLPLVLRGGAWSDPDHQLRFITNSPTDVFGFSYHRGDDVLHWTGGAGLVFREGRYQLDLAFDVSDRADVLTLSTVASF